MRQSAIVRIIIYSLLILLLVGLLISGLALTYGWRGIAGLVADELDLDEVRDGLRKPQDSSYVTAEQGSILSLDPAQVQEIEVDWISGDILIEHGAVEKIELNETVTDKPMVYALEDGKLVIKFCQDMRKPKLTANMESKALSITLPEGWMGKQVEVQSVSADVTLRNLKLSEAEYQGVSGEYRMEDCKIGELSVETVSGNVKVRGEIQELECEGVSADCDLILHNVPEEISMESVSGNLRLTLPGDAGFTAELEGISKNLETDFAVTKENGKYISGDGSCLIEMEGVSGRAYIQKASEK